MDSNEPGTLLIDRQGAGGFEEFMPRIEIPYIGAFEVHPRAGERRSQERISTAADPEAAGQPLAQNSGTAYGAGGA
jgi:hypothetical protein